MYVSGTTMLNMTSLFWTLQFPGLTGFKVIKFFGEVARPGTSLELDVGVADVVGGAVVVDAVTAVV